MRKISSILLFALIGAGIVSAQEEAVAPASGKVSRDRYTELLNLNEKLDQDYAALKSSGVTSAVDAYVEAKGRIKSALSFIERKPGARESALVFQACSVYVASAFLQFKRESNVFETAKIDKSRDSLQNELHRLHEDISRIEGGRAYKLSQDLEANKEKTSRLQSDLDAKKVELDAKKAELDAERAHLRKVKQEAQMKFDELRSAMISVSKDARGTIISMADILFDPGKATLKPELEKSLSKIAGILTIYREPNIVIEGHTDNLGAKEYNQKLSEERAKAVLNYLVKEGIAETRLTAVGYGSEVPVVDNATKEGRAKNRRVELVIQDKTLDGEGADDAPDGK